MAVAISGGMKGFEEEAQVPAVPREHVSGQGGSGAAVGHRVLAPLSSQDLALPGPKRGKGKGCNVLGAVGWALAGLATGDQARQELAQEELLPLSLTSVGEELGKAWLKDEPSSHGSEG